MREQIMKLEEWKTEHFKKKKKIQTGQRGKRKDSVSAAEKKTSKQTG